MEGGKYAFFKRVEKKDPIMELVFSLQIDKLLDDHCYDVFQCGFKDAVGNSYR